MPRFRLLLGLLMAALSAFAPAIGRALTVLPPASFEALVAAADLVVRGVVTDVHTEEFDSPSGRGIRTLVTLRVERTLKGEAGGTVTLRMLGGTSGARTLKIPGMPTFNVGDREIVFIAGNGQSFCPLVRIGHGRYHVRTDAATGREYITRDNHAPLTTLDDVVLPLEIPVVATRLGAVTAALSPAAFETSIASAVAQQELAHSNR